MSALPRIRVTLRPRLNEAIYDVVVDYPYSAARASDYYSMSWSDAEDLRKQLGLTPNHCTSSRLEIVDRLLRYLEGGEK